MILFTIITLINLYKIRNMHSSTKSKRDRRFAIIIITNNFIFLTLNIPYCILNVLNYDESTDLANFIKAISFFLLYLNSISAFFINFSFNSMFRNELNNFFGRKNIATNSRQAFTTI
jgi:hypothetical protein